jgi:N6-adenosine-specific RNA methylase IME4
MKGIVEIKAKANQVASGEKFGKGSQKSDEPITPIRTDKEVAKLAEISHDTIRKIEKIALTGSPELVQAVRSGEISINLASDLATLEKDKQNAVVGSGKKVAQEAVKAIKQEQAQVKKEARRDVINAQVEAISQGTLEQPQGLFDVIAIDPPWNYGREYDPDTSRVANPYPEMTQEQIKAIELPANDDAVLFLWTTHQFLFDAKELLDHWGFTYKATMVWDKERIGMGAWLRMQCEFCLVGIKGKPFWDNTEHRDIIREARREHSRKPEAFYTTVEKITAGRRLEYFARSAHTGWEVFGNDTSKF